MFRSKNEKSVDMTCTSHRQRIHAMAAAAKGQNLEVAMVIGGLILDKISALIGVPGDTDDFEVLGGFYGAPAKMVKCETIDVLVPANAELVLECELMATEGLNFDEGPYGEFTGMYGGGMKHNYRLKINDILKHFHGQPYKLIYGAFGNLRHKLGRMNTCRGTVTPCPIVPSPSRRSRQPCRTSTRDMSARRRHDGARTLTMGKAPRRIVVGITGATGSSMACASRRRFES